MSTAKCISVLLVLAMALLMASHIAAISCSDAVNALIPCSSYLVGDGPDIPTRECCTSAQKLNKLADNVASRRALCECFKETGPSFGVKPERARGIISYCKLNVNVTVSPDVNCATI